MKHKKIVTVVGLTILGIQITSAGDVITVGSTSDQPEGESTIMREVNEHANSEPDSVTVFNHTLFSNPQTIISQNDELNALCGSFDQRELFKSEDGDGTVVCDKAAVEFGASLVWDEAVDGDLSSVRDMPTEVVLTDLRNIITATVGGSSEDESDVFTFFVPPGFELEAVILNDYIAAGDNETSGLNFHLGDMGNATPQVSFIAMGEANIGENTIDTSSGLLPSGSYSILVIEFTPGQTYELDIQLSLADLIFKDGFDD